MAPSRPQTRHATPNCSGRGHIGGVTSRQRQPHGGVSSQRRFRRLRTVLAGLTSFYRALTRWPLESALGLVLKRISLAGPARIRWNNLARGRNAPARKPRRRALESSLHVLRIRFRRDSGRGWTEPLFRHRAVRGFI